MKSNVTPIRKPGAERARSSRVNALRNRIVDAPREVCVERARYVTQSYAQNWGEHPLTRISLALAHILDNITVVIRDGELIVSCRTSKLNGAPLFPENKSKWIEGDLETFNDRVLQKVSIQQSEQEELRNLMPFWRGKTIEDRLEELLPADVAEDMDKYIFTMILEMTYGVGHFTMDHSTILRKGYSGLASDAAKKLIALPGEDKRGAKALFYEAMIRSLEAGIIFANRYADLAEEMSTKETDPARAAELETIAEACRRVPENPPRNFHEAVQSLYFTHLISQIESGGNSISIGRIDQILFPYYDADIKAGRTTPEQARELLSLLFIKTNEIWNILEEAYIPGGEGVEGKTTQNVTIGGVDKDGKDATNALSYIALDAYSDVRTVQPNLSVRVDADTPEDFFRKAAACAADGVLLHIFNDRVVVDSLAGAGHTIEDARNYGVVGCVEPNAQGKSFGSTFAVQFSGIKCLEFALTNGIDNTFGYMSGIETGDISAFKTFDDIWNAYCSQVTHFMNQMRIGMGKLDHAVAELLPSPFASAMIQGPMEKGIDLTSGGAVYNSTGVQLIGFANVVDSLYAIKKAVFEDGVMTLQELAALIEDDWYGAEKKRQYFLKKIPKYGNDSDEVDEMAQKVMEHYCKEVFARETYRGGRFWPGVFSVGFHIAMGSFAGASADGRMSGQVLGNGITPTNGNAVAGPTAVINSVSKLPLAMAFNGANLNLRFNGSLLKPEIFASLIKTFLAKGGYQVQFNMVDTETLKQAVDRPDDYRDLVVRVSGYSALFTGLSDLAQEEIIARTEYELSDVGATR